MRRTIAALTVVGISLLAAGPASATFPGANGRIAYVGSGGIHTVLPNGQDDKLRAFGDMPSWSASGQRIAFSRTINFDPDTGGNNEIYTMSQMGSDLRRLTHNPAFDSQPSYSPSGNRLIFTRTAAQSRVMKMRADGSDLESLGAGVAYEFSPDGQRIAYGAPRATASGRESVWTMRRNGTDKRRLVLLGKNGGSLGSYSPDGRHITFSRCGSEVCRAFMAKSDGANVRPLPCPPDFFRGTTAPSYSPSGHQLLGEIRSGKPGSADVVRLPLNACSPKVIVTSSTAALPAWQPLPST
jgi:TolB protein